MGYLHFRQNAPASRSEAIALIDKFSSISDYFNMWNKSTVLPIHSTIQLH